VPLAAEPPAGFAREIFRAAGIEDVLIERHAVREPLGGEGRLSLHAGERTVLVREGQGVGMPASHGIATLATARLGYSSDFTRFFMGRAMASPMLSFN
jgi:hypothetical protein